MSVETREAPVGHDHVVQFYADDDELIESVTTYLEDGLRAGEVAIVVATPPHAEALDEALAARGIDVGAARSSRHLISADASATLSRIMTGGTVDAEAFELVIGRLVRQSLQIEPTVRAYGEMVALLWEDGNVAGAIEVEGLWNDLGLELPFSLFCSYPAETVAGEHHLDALHEVCRLHSATTHTFATGTDAPGAARRFVTGTLEQWGRSDLVNDAAVVVTELATNAVLHSQGAEFAVVVSQREQGVRIAVRDPSPVLPRLLDPPPTATAGRGVGLIAALSVEWGSERAGAGKTVWADLR